MGFLIAALVIVCLYAGLLWLGTGGIGWGKLGK